MSHPFGDLVSQHLHRKHGLSQSKLAEAMLQKPTIVTRMCKGERLTGPQARERVVAIIGWLRQQSVLDTLDEANALLDAAGMSSLHGNGGNPIELALAQTLHPEREPEVAARLIDRARQVNGTELASSVHTSSTSSIPEDVVRLPIRKHNLPAELTSFIGRMGDIEEIAAQVRVYRLVTLIGAGGIGKTRLAIEVAADLLDDFDHGVWFVELAPLADPELIPKTILATISTSRNGV